MTAEQAIKVLDEIKTNDDSLTQYIRGFDEAIDMAIHSLEHTEPQKIIQYIDFAIESSSGKTDYMIGLRNGIRVIKSYIDGKEPQYEKCAKPQKRSEE